MRHYRLAAVTGAVLLFASWGAPAAEADWRNIETGLEIPSEGYCDQPYAVVLDDGAWLVVMTTGPGHEGQGGQHVVSTTTRDHGRTWTPLTDIEPATGPEASWAMPLKTDFGRVYAFYSYNGDNIHTLGDKTDIRADTIGWYCYRYTDDGGKTWSAERYRLPMRTVAVDRMNDWNGAVQIFWGIGKPVRLDGAAVFAFTRIGRYMLEQSEGWFYRSANVLTERDADQLQWELFPEGEHGLRAEPFGSIQSEQNIVPLSGGALYCMYRTTTGHPCHAYSRDGGRTWTTPEHATYTPGGRAFKHPRACPRIWRTKNGRFLFWFHNHGGKGFDGRNPVWIAGGVERDGFIHWSQPEILFYHVKKGDFAKGGRGGVRMSYPDLIEQDGRYWITETQKSIARVHEVDAALIEGLFTPPNPESLTAALDWRAGGAPAAMPVLPSLDGLEGFALAFDLRLDNIEPGQTLFDTRGGGGKGVRVATAEGGCVEAALSDGAHKTAWTTDAGLLEAGKSHRVAVLLDAGADILCFVVDGVLCDGGAARQFGWRWFSPGLGDVNGPGPMHMGAGVQRLRIYPRRLRTAEAVALTR